MAVVGAPATTKRSVDLTVLQGVGAVTEALIGGIDLGELAFGVQIAQTVSAEDIHGVEIHAGAGGAHGDVLTGKVGHSLDAGIGGHDLHILHVQGRHGGEAVDGVFKEVRAVIGIGHYVGLAEGQLRVAVGQLLHVGLGAVAYKAGDCHIGIVGSVLGDDGAEGIIGAGLAAGDKAQLRGRSAAAEASPEESPLLEEALLPPQAASESVIPKAKSKDKNFFISNPSFTC